MANNVRTHLSGVNDSATPSVLRPKHLAKADFGRRLYSAMIKKGWQQSDLANASGMQRANVSNYVRGQSMPTPQNLKKLADALGIDPDLLLPNMAESAIDQDAPSFEMKASVQEPGKAWLRVNRLVRFDTAVKVGELLEADNATDRS